MGRKESNQTNQIVLYLYWNILLLQLHIYM